MMQKKKFGAMTAFPVFQDSVWGSSSTTSTDVWAGPPSWDPIVLGDDEEEGDDSGGYAYGDIK